MNVYNFLGEIINSSFSEQDFNLTIEFENLPYKESEEIIILIRNSSSECNKDIIQLARIIIDKLDFINYNIVRNEYKTLVSLIHVLFKTLISIQNKTELMIIYNDFNKYIKGRPNSSNPTSPVSPPSLKN